MSRHNVTVTLEIDDDALAEHLAAANGERPPYSADLNDWNVDDIARAIELDIIDTGDCDFNYLGELS
jgi:hypothetical protein